MTAPAPGSHRTGLWPCQFLARNNSAAPYEGLSRCRTLCYCIIQSQRGKNHEGKVILTLNLGSQQPYPIGGAACPPG
jgi:hypothetical protein